MRLTEVKQVVRRAVMDERRRCQELVAGCVMTKPSPIGPLHGVGWNEAIHEVGKRLLDAPVQSITILRPETVAADPSKLKPGTIVAGQALIGDEIVDRKRTPNITGFHEADTDGGRVWIGLPRT